MAGETPAGGALTAESIQEMVENTVARLVNSAISARDKQADKKREQDKADFKKMLEESLAAKPAQAQAEEESGKGKGGKGNEANVELSTMRKQMDDMRRMLEQEQSARQAAEQRERTVALRDTVTTSLQQFGIDGARARAAIAVLTSEGRIIDDRDNDRILFRDDTSGEVDLSVGMKSWIKSEDAKIFLPPTGAKGAATRPGAVNPQSNGNSNAPMDQSTKLARIGQALASHFGE